MPLCGKLGQSALCARKADPAAREAPPPFCSTIDENVRSNSPRAWTSKNRSVRPTECAPALRPEVTTGSM
jgi:hypothetical protein